jgi:hypothetical protein
MVGCPASSCLSVSLQPKPDKASASLALPYGNAKSLYFICERSKNPPKNFNSMLRRLALRDDGF